jgi:Holliday junction DNA helicase RuvA
VSEPGRPATVVNGAWREQVYAGLLGLGWSAKEAEAACDRVAPMAEEAATAGDAPAVPELLRAALRTLSKA